MKYRIKFEVYDNDGGLLSSNVLNEDLTNPTVNDIKLISNRGTYMNIKSETFIGNGKPDLVGSDVLTSTFVSYRIDLM